MFDFVFDAFSAFNAMGCLFGAFVMLLIGGLLVGYWVFWRLTSYRVKGRIVAVHSTGTRRTKEDWEKQYELEKAAEEKEGNKESDKEFLEQLGHDFKTAPFKSFFAYLIVLIFLLTPFVFFGIGAWFTYDFLELKTNGIKVEAKVTGWDSEYDSESGTMYYAKVAFTALDGEQYNLRDRLGVGGDRPFEDNRNIHVYYDPDDPERFAIDAFWHYMIFSFAFMGISGVFIGLYLYGLYSQLSGKQPGETASAAKKRREIERIRKNHYINQKYIPVYELMTRGGETMQIAGHDDSSNWLANKIPGKDVTLMVRPGKKGKPPIVKKPGILLLLFGLIFVMPGLLFLNIGLANLSFNPGAVFGVLLVIGLIGYKAAVAIKEQKEKNREQGGVSWQDIKKDLDDFKDLKKFTIEVEPHKLSGYEMTEQEITNRLRLIDRNSILAVPILILFGIGMLAGGHQLFKDVYDLSSKALIAQGSVVSMQSRSSSGSGDYVYYPQVRFKSIDGEAVQFEGRSGSNPPSYKVGDKVMVLYDPEKPHRAMINNDWMNWLPAIGVTGLGILMFIYGLMLLAGICSRTLAYRRKAL